MTDPASRAMLIVLSYNGASDTIECLDSICRSKPDTADILVIDNASAPGTVEAIASAFPDVEIVVLAENAGWAGGNNAGIRLALSRGYAQICLMNNDLWVQPHALARMLDAASIIGPCLMHPAIYAYHDPAVPQHDPSRYAQPLADHPGLYPMDYAYGACLLIHAEIFRTIGLMDERFFLQMEETDFYLRAVVAGYSSVSCAGARVLHKESVSLGGVVSPMKTYYITRNRLLLAEKHARGLRAYLRSLREALWSFWALAGNELSLLRVLVWLGSGHAHAIAGRLGVWDYVLRRFGRMGETRLKAIKRSSFSEEKEAKKLHSL